MDRPLRIVQLSDVHLSKEPHKLLLGVNTEESFRAVIDHIKKNHDYPDLVLLSGDLSQDGSKESYIRVAEMLADLASPVYVIPGNHDNVHAMKAVYPYGPIRIERHVLFHDWQMILLNSHKENAVEGHLDQQEFNFLKTCLEKSSLPALMSFHHQPVSVGSMWLDRLGVCNAEEFWQEIKSFPQINTILFGHVHQEHEGERQGVRYYSTPSTCIQFKAKSREFALDKIGPGYRWLELYQNGKMKTLIKRVPYYIGEFLKDAKGY